MKRIFSLTVTIFLLFSMFSTTIGFAESREQKEVLKREPGSAKMEQQRKREPYAPGELLVQFKKGVKVEAAVKRYGFKVKDVIKEQNIAVVQFDESNISMESADRTLSKDNSITYVQPNYKYHVNGFTNDIYSGELWGLDNYGQTDFGGRGTPGTADMDINLPEAWEEIEDQNLNEIVVGVIDTGVDINHPDLVNNIWTNPGEIPNDGIDNDGNGYKDDVHGWDFCRNDNTVFDKTDIDAHGTHVAGTIAASIDNEKGVAGIAPNVKIMPLKFICPEGGYDAQAIEAINYADNMGVKITNNSWGGYFGEQEDLLHQAIDNADMLFVASAGNDTNDNDELPSYPDGYNSPNILAVAAVDNKGRLASFSNYGKETVDVAAPGVSILSTVPDAFDVGAAVEVDSGTYKAIVNGFGFEHIIDPAEREDAFTKAMDFLGASDSSNILLVHDDQSDSGWPPYLEEYEELLSWLGYDYTTQSVSTDSNGPGKDTLKQYDVVIWFTGMGDGDIDQYALTDTDIESLSSYLNDGGRLLLSGMDILWGNEKNDFVQKQLGINILNEDYAGNVTGQAGTIYENSEYEVQPFEVEYADFYASNNEALTKVNLEYHVGASFYDGYDYYNGTSMAAPHAAGAAAVLLGLHPDAPATSLIDTLKQSGRPMTSGANQIATGKIIDLQMAINSFDPVDPSDPFGFTAIKELYDSSQYVEGQTTGKTKVTIKVNSTGTVYSQDTDENGRFKVKVGYLPAGSTLTLKAAAGTNVKEETIKVLKDVTPPALFDVTANDLNTFIEGQVSEEATVQVKIGTKLIPLQPAATDEQGYFKVTTGKLKGVKEVTLIVKDRAATPNQAEFDIVVHESVPPIISKVKPVYNTSNYIEGSINESAFVWINSVDSKGNVLDHLGDTWVDGSTFKIPLEAKLAKGTKLAIQAEDQFGNMSKIVSLSVADDKVPPKLLEPKTIVLTDNGEQTVTGQLDEAGRVEVKVGGTVIASKNTDAAGKFSVTVPKLAANTKVMFVFYDTGTAKAEKAVTVTDGTKPVIEAASIQPVYDTSKYVIGKVSEPATVTAEIGGKVVGKAKTDANGNFQLLVNRKAVGTTIVLKAQDAAKPKSLSSDPVTIVVKKDTVDPVLDLASVTLNDASISFEGKVSEEANVQAKINGVVINKKPVATKADGTFKISVGKQKAGTVVTLSMVDYAGNESVEMLTVQDRTAPVVTKINPVYNTSTAVSGKVSEQANIHIYTVDKKNNITGEVTHGSTDGEGNFALSLVNELPVNTKLMVKATDTSNMTSKFVYTTVKKDTVAPTFVTPLVVTNQTTTLTGQLTEQGTIQVKINNQIVKEAATESDGRFIIELDNPQPVKTKMTFILKDKVNNVKSVVVTVKKS